MSVFIWQVAAVQLTISMSPVHRLTEDFRELQRAFSCHLGDSEAKVRSIGSCDSKQPSAGYITRSANGIRWPGRGSRGCLRPIRATNACGTGMVFARGSCAECDLCALRRSGGELRVHL